MNIKIKKIEKQNIMTSIVICLIGIILMFFPETTVTVVSYIIGSVLLFIGIFKIGAHYIKKESNNMEISSGIIITLLGLVIYMYGSNILEIVRILIGIFLVYNGAIKLILSLQLSKLSNRISRISIIFASILILFGIFILFYSKAILFTIGLALVIYSVINLIQNFIYTKGVSNLDKKEDVVIIDEEK